MQKNNAENPNMCFLLPRKWNHCHPIAFQDEELFDVITKLSYPEIGTFFEDYVAGSKPLPIEEYLAETGFQYYDKKIVKDIKANEIK